MSDLKNLATLYSDLLSEAEALPPLFKTLVQQSKRFVDLTNTASEELHEAASAKDYRKGSLLEKAGGSIEASSEPFRRMSKSLERIAGIKTRILAIKKQISEELSA